MIRKGSKRSTAGETNLPLVKEPGVLAAGSRVISKPCPLNRDKGLDSGWAQCTVLFG